MMKKNLNDVALPNTIAKGLLAILCRTSPRSIDDQNFLLHTIDLLNAQLQHGASKNKF